MKSTEVTIGATYIAKVSGKLVPVVIEAEGIGGGYWAKNLQTSRTIRLRSARRLRSLVEAAPSLVVYTGEEDARRYEIVNGLPRWVGVAMNRKSGAEGWTG